MVRLTGRIDGRLFALLVASAVSAPAVASVSDVDVLLASNGAAVAIVESDSVSNTDFQSLIDPNYADALSGLDTLSTNSASNTDLSDSLSASFTTEAALKLTSVAVGSISFTGSTSASASGPSPSLALAELLILGAIYDFGPTSAEVVTLTYRSTASISIPGAWDLSVNDGASTVFSQSIGVDVIGQDCRSICRAPANTLWVFPCRLAPIPMRPRSSVLPAEARPARPPPHSTSRSHPPRCRSRRPGRPCCSASRASALSAVASRARAPRSRPEPGFADRARRPWEACSHFAPELLRMAAPLVRVPLDVDRPVALILSPGSPTRAAPCMRRMFRAIKGEDERFRATAYPASTSAQ